VLAVLPLSSIYFFSNFSFIYVNLFILQDIIISNTIWEIIETIFKITIIFNFTAILYWRLFIWRIFAYQINSKLSHNDIIKKVALNWSLRYFSLKIAKILIKFINKIIVFIRSWSTLKINKILIFEENSCLLKIE